MVLGFHSSNNDTNSVMETYTIKVHYNMTGLSSMDILTISYPADCMAANDIESAVIIFLNKIVVLGTILEPLPDDISITVRMLYYDEATPPDYEPKGFKYLPSELYTCLLTESEQTSFNIGAVTSVMKSKNNSLLLYLIKLISLKSVVVNKDETCNKLNTFRVKMRMQSSCHQLHKEIASLQKNSVKRKRYMTTSNQPKIKIKKEASCLSSASLTQDDSDATIDGLEPGIFESEKKNNKDLIRCSCGCNVNDGLMIMCDSCNTWQHTLCYKICSTRDVPRKHFCIRCCLDNATPSTDTSLKNLTPKILQLTCLWRRSLIAIYEYPYITCAGLASRLGANMSVTRQVLKRLDKKGLVASPFRGRDKRIKIVNVDRVLNEVMGCFQLRSKGKTETLVRQVLQLKSRN
ncbi:HORMA domain-containing protein 1 [Trichoplax sp. H2]|nr:HORMA domain-containing protein 1 [Trichoplax sp. H2]|eukprot:RDD46648.1 HORMA domain-containing protein 1 [Trichoplax sp. H2]